MMKQKNFGCPRCSYSTKEEINMEIKEEINENINVAVIDKDEEEKINPVTSFDCPNPKCNSKKAYFWMRQMRAGDEPETRFYKCVKCGKVSRGDERD